MSTRQRPGSASETSQRRTSSVPHWLLWGVCFAFILVNVHAGSACAGAVQIPRQPAGVRCYARARLDAPQGSTEFPGLLDKHGRGNHGLCNSLHRHVRRQAHRQAHDRRQSEDIAPDPTLPPSGPHCSRGTANNSTSGIFTSSVSAHHRIYDILYDIIGQICQ